MSTNSETFGTWLGHYNDDKEKIYSVTLYCSEQTGLGWDHNGNVWKTCLLRSTDNKKRFLRFSVCKIAKEGNLDEHGGYKTFRGVTSEDHNKIVGFYETNGECDEAFSMEKTDVDDSMPENENWNGKSMNNGSFKISMRKNFEDLIHTDEHGIQTITKRNNLTDYEMRYVVFSTDCENEIQIFRGVISKEGGTIYGFNDRNDKTIGTFIMRKHKIEVYREPIRQAIAVAVTEVKMRGRWIGNFNGEGKPFWFELDPDRKGRFFEGADKDKTPMWFKLVEFDGSLARLCAVYKKDTDCEDGCTDLKGVVSADCLRIVGFYCKDGKPAGTFVMKKDDRPFMNITDVDGKWAGNLDDDSDKEITLNFQHDNFRRQNEGDSDGTMCGKELYIPSSSIDSFERKMGFSVSFTQFESAEGDNAHFDMNILSAKEMVGSYTYKKDIGTLKLTKEK